MATQQERAALDTAKNSSSDIVTCAYLSHWIYGPDAATPSARASPPSPADLPDGMEISCAKDSRGIEQKHCHWANSTAGGSGPVQCAILHKKSDVGKKYLVFRGTKDPFDWTKNIAVTAIPMASADGLVVHGGMLAGLLDVSPGTAVLDSLTAELQGVAGVVVCGHSLGGGYALIAAAHFLGQGLPVSKIFTYGSPFVLNKGQDGHPIWQQLHERATGLVYNCDIVPRTLSPTAMSWVFEFVPNHLLNTYAAFFFKKTLTDLISQLRHNETVLYSFRPCGTTLFFAHQFQSRRTEFSQSSDLEVECDRKVDKGWGIVPTVDVVLSRSPDATVRVLGMLCDAPGQQSTTTLAKDHKMYNYMVCAGALRR